MADSRQNPESNVNGQSKIDQVYPAPSKAVTDVINSDLADE